MVVPFFCNLECSGFVRRTCATNSTVDSTAGCFADAEARGPRFHAVVRFSTCLPEADGEPSTEHDVNRAAEARPPNRHAGVRGQRVMDEEIKEPMSGDTSRSQPHALLEAEYCKDGEHQSNCNLHLQRHGT